MRYEFARWLPALCSWVPAPAGCCDTSRAVNVLKPAEFPLLIHGVCVRTLSLPRCSVLFSEPFGSLLHIAWDSSALALGLLLPWTLDCCLLLIPSEAGRALMAGRALPKAPREAALQGWQRVSEVHLPPSLRDAGRQRRSEPALEGGGLTAAVPGHSISVRGTHSLLLTLL